MSRKLIDDLTVSDLKEIHKAVNMTYGEAQVFLLDLSKTLNLDDESIMEAYRFSTKLFS